MKVKNNRELEEWYETWKLNKAVAEFWKRIDIKDKSSCWIWKGTKVTGGYGRLSFQGEMINSHRLAYILSHNLKHNHDICGVVMHSCDNPPCCNPYHLKLGTTEENIKDAARKGRLGRKKVQQ